MKKRIIFFVLVVSVLLIACNLLSPADAPSSDANTDPSPEAVNPEPTNTKVTPTIAFPTNTLMPTYTMMPSSTFTPTPDFSGTIIGDGVNIRKGPDTVYDVVKSYEKDTPVVVTGKNGNCSWVKIDLPDGKSGWIRADLLDFSISCSLLKVPSIPPTPTPRPYVPPTATACVGSTVSVKIIKNINLICFL